jgi:hypothetical protein
MNQVKTSGRPVLLRRSLGQSVWAQLLSITLHVAAALLIFVGPNVRPSNDGAFVWVFAAPKGGNQAESRPRTDPHLLAPVTSSVVLTAAMLDRRAASNDVREPPTQDAGTVAVDVAGCQLRIRPDDGVQITKALQVYHGVLGFAASRDQVQLQYAYRFDDGGTVGPISRDAYFAVELRHPSRSNFVTRFRSAHSIPEAENVVFALFPLEFDADMRELVRKKLIGAGRGGTAEQASVSFSMTSPKGYLIESILLRPDQ